MQTIINPPKNEWEILCNRPLLDNSSLEKDVREIMDAVRSEGDAALKRFSRRFDSSETDHFEIGKETIELSGKQLDGRLKDALKLAARNIETFHLAQKPADISVTTMPGIECSQRSLPIARVGLYIPGGSAPLFSTVLMLGIPARISRLQGGSYVHASGKREGNTSSNFICCP
jgi:histidinol dehydrogenase